MNIKHHIESPTHDLGGKDKAFSQGGNRLCFVHPESKDLCIKVLRPDRLPILKRREKSFPKNLKSLSAFDDNLQEAKTFQQITNEVGEQAYSLIPRCHGFVDTNYGKGLCIDLIRDHSGTISVTLKQYLWENGKTAIIEQLLHSFGERWVALCMPSRNLLLHNIVVQCNENGPAQLIVIDGLGWQNVISLARYIKPLARRKAARKVKRLWLAVDALLAKKSNNEDYGYHGWLSNDQRNQ